MRPHTSYFICGTQRSGSTLLCELLKNTHLAGYPEEYFDALKSTGVPQRPLEYFTGVTDEALMNILKGRNHPDEEQRQPPPGMSYESYVNSIIEKSTSPNGVFGTKVMWNYFSDFVSKLRDIPYYHALPTTSLLSTIFPNLHYIFITRRDKVAQAISLWKGLLTWKWRAEDITDVNGKQEALNELPFHFGAIDHLVRYLERSEQGWLRFFAAYHIRPLTIVFENLITSKEQTAQNVLRYLDIIDQPDILVPPYMRRQADGLSEKWVQQYHLIKERRENMIHLQGEN